MRNKTFWQWSAVTAFWVGWLLQLIALFISSMLPLILMFALWGYALWCVAYKPVRYQ